MGMCFRKRNQKRKEKGILIYSNIKTKIIHVLHSQGLVIHGIAFPIMLWARLCGIPHIVPLS